MAAKLWRLLCAIFDAATWLRWLAQKPLMEVAFITNMRDDVDRKIFLGTHKPQGGHFNGPRYRFCGIIGRTRSIDSTAPDLVTIGGRKNAKLQFLAATKWAVDRGARVILLAAGTKRLFNDGKILQERFPGTIFTIGDNGTMLLLQKQALDALENSGLEPMRSAIAVLGPYGFLGKMMVGSLRERGYRVIGLGRSKGALRRISDEFGIDVYVSFAEMGKVDAVIACTHSDGARLTIDTVETIRKPGRKLLVVDVAEPSNLVQEEYVKCRDRVIRLDAGNAYNPRLKYVLGAISYRMFRLGRNITFGCFAEAIALASAVRRGEDVSRHNWLEVSENNLEVIARLFAEDGFVCPPPSCFYKRVESFSLLYVQNAEIMEWIRETQQQFVA